MLRKPQLMSYSKGTSLFWLLKLVFTSGLHFCKCCLQGWVKCWLCYCTNNTQLSKATQSMHFPIVWCVVYIHFAAGTCESRNAGTRNGTRNGLERIITIDFACLQIQSACLLHPQTPTACLLHLQTPTACLLHLQTSTAPPNTHCLPSAPPDTHCLPSAPPDTHCLPSAPPDTHCLPSAPPDTHCLLTSLLHLQIPTLAACTSRYPQLASCTS